MTMAVHEKINLEACPGCGCGARTAVYSQPDATLGELRLEKCDRCEFVFLNPRLHMSSSAALEDESPVYDMPPDQRELVIATWMNEIRHTAQLAGKAGGRLLDFGCNRGLLMEAARRVGWQVTGIDISADALAKARRDYDLNVHQGPLADGHQLGVFDLITCWHVFEHVDDIGGTLTAIRSLLAPDGALVLQVPSYDMISGFWSRGTPSAILCAVHNNYFTRGTLVRILQQHGFRPIVVINSEADLMLTTVCVREHNLVRHVIRRLRWLLWRC